ncbi:MAG TPA: hypothetical protein V6C76_11455 [Drouetiella sp.]
MMLKVLDGGNLDYARTAAKVLLENTHPTATDAETMTIYYWRVKTRLPERFGQRCRVLVRGKMNNCLVEFEDGYKVVTSRNYVRKVKSG